MTLGEYIDALTAADQSKLCTIGFSNPHSYRGFYYELAFEPVENITVAEMLAVANGCVSMYFQGYKGGEFRMGIYTNCWVAEWGSTGSSLSPVELGFVLGVPPKYDLQPKWPNPLKKAHASPDEI